MIIQQRVSSLVISHRQTDRQTDMVFTYGVLLYFVKSTLKRSKV